jgi:hypothetical protein
VDSDDVRIGTQEREAAASMLAEHLGAGRIEVDEYEARVTAVIAARTRGELRPVFADLPPPRPAGLRTPAPLSPTDAGRLPDELRTRLAAEGVLVLAENLRGSITYRDYRAPDEYSNWAKEPASGTVAMSGRRLMVWAGGAKRVDVPFDHPMRATVEVSTDRPDRLCIVLRPHARANWSGRIELRFRTTMASTIAQLWDSR